LSSQNKTRINGQIKASQIRLINHEGTMIGVVPLQQGLEMALAVGLDLIEVSPNTDPPVCKIIDYGKLKYQAQKKANEAKKKQKTVETKEIKMSLNIGLGDYTTKMNQAKKFLEKGHKVRVSFRFRGREITHIDLVKEMIAKIIDSTEDIAKIDTEPKLEGYKLFMILAPIK